MAAIKVENLSKVFRITRKAPGVAGSIKALFRPQFENKIAVDGISFSVDRGEIVGYIGVNGAGKSTTIKMLTGILMPTAGQVCVLDAEFLIYFSVFSASLRCALFKMIQSLRRQLNIYAAFAAMMPKLQLAYSTWVWMEFIAQIIAMTIFVFFWRAVYSNTDSLNGLGFQQTLNYILLAQIISPLIQARVVFQFGFLIQNGQIGVELIRPVDTQLRHLVEALAGLIGYALQKTPLFLIAVIFYGLQLTTNPVIWLAFTLTLVLGCAVTFYFDWMFGCLAFYTTETWGLSVVRNGIATFFSGVLIPIPIMPTWLQQLAGAMPFAQGIYVPASLLSGIVSLNELPQILSIQIA